VKDRKTAPTACKMFPCQAALPHHIQGGSKTAQSLWHHNFATVRHRVMWFSAKCSERNSLHN